MTLATYLGLRDPDRDSLEPDPVRDIDLYVDLDGQVNDCMARLARRAPKLVLMGDYGTGKTHLLHVIQSKVDRDRFEPVYVKLEAYGRIAESRHLHADLLTALEEGGCLSKALEGMETPGDSDLRQAVQYLRQMPTHAVAKAWLFARGPTPARALKAGFSAPLSMVARGVRYAGIWQALADGYRKATDRELLFLIDESEVFQHQVDQSRAADLGAAVREMVDAANKSYGVVLGLTAPRGRVDNFSAHPLGRPDVASRVQGAMLDLSGLGEPERRRRFIIELLDRLLIDRGHFLAPDAIEALVRYGPQWAQRLKLLDREPVQREYVKLLDRIARRAWERRLPLPLTADIFDGAPPA